MGNQVQWLRGDRTSTSLHFFKLVSFSLRLIMECTGYEFLLSICRSSEFIEGNKAICFLIYTLYNMWQTYLVVYIKYCIIIIFLLFYMCDQSNLFNYSSSNSSFAQLDMHYNIYCFYSLHDITQFWEGITYHMHLDNSGLIPYQCCKLALKKSGNIRSALDWMDVLVWMYSHVYVHHFQE